LVKDKRCLIVGGAFWWAALIAEAGAERGDIVFRHAAVRHSGLVVHGFNDRKHAARAGLVPAPRFIKLGCLNPFLPPALTKVLKVETVDKPRGGWN
jgi:hypothetical protein